MRCSSHDNRVTHGEFSKALEIFWEMPGKTEMPTFGTNDSSPTNGGDQRESLVLFRYRRSSRKIQTATGAFIRG